MRVLRINCLKCPRPPHGQFIVMRGVPGNTVNIEEVLKNLLSFLPVEPKLGRKLKSRRHDRHLPTAKKSFTISCCFKGGP